MGFAAVPLNSGIQRKEQRMEHEWPLCVDEECSSPAVYDTPAGPMCGTHAFRAHWQAEDLALLEGYDQPDNYM